MFASNALRLGGFEVPVEIVVLGLLAGLTYALLGIGLTLTYKTSRVLNFAFGEIGALAATSLTLMVLKYDVPYWLALPIALLIAMAIGGLMQLVVIARLERSSRLIALVATIAVSQALFAILLLLPNVNTLERALFPTPFDVQISVGDLTLGAGQLIILGVAPLTALGLAAFLQRTRIGLASRATADNSTAAELAGVPIRRVSLAVWIIAGLLAGVGAILIGPTRPIANLGAAVAAGPQLLIRALAAAMLGGLTSFRRVFVGGVGIGLFEALIQWNYPTGGLLELLLFGVILVALLWQRSLGLRTRPSETSSWTLAGSINSIEASIARSTIVRVTRYVMLLVSLSAAVAIPVALDSARLAQLSTVAVFAIIGLSLLVLTGLTGQVSLGQFAFVGLGALVGGRLLQLGYPSWMAMLYASLSGALVALVIGLPALRLRGLFLAVTTLGFSVASSVWLFQQEWLVRVGGGSSSLSIARHSWLGIQVTDELHYYWLCLAWFVIIAALVHRLRRTGVGRMLIAVRDNEQAAAALGVGPRHAKLLAFSMSGAIAGFAGYLYGGLLVNFPDLLIFGPEQSLILIAMVIIGGITTITGVVLGAIFVKGMPAFLHPWIGSLVGPKLTILLTGVGLLVILLQNPGGLAVTAFRVRDRFVGWLAAGREHAHAADLPSVYRFGTSSRDARAPIDDVPPLQADEVVVAYGGLTAVAGVSLYVAPGEILGLLGPNGAGKTTLFDVLGGQVLPTSGRVLLNGHDVTFLRPEERARRGLGRSFQQGRLFGDLSIAECFKIALEREQASELVPSVLGLPPSRRWEREKDRRADELVNLLGLAPFGSRKVSELSTGTRRIAELGCLLALGSEVILFDEPTAGIAQRDVEAFGPVLRDVQNELGATMLIVEHDVPLMLDLVDRVYVLSAGKVIAEGNPTLLLDDPQVIEAFLGTDESVIYRSGAVAATLE